MALLARQTPPNKFGPLSAGIPPILTRKAPTKKSSQSTQLMQTPKTRNPRIQRSQGQRLDSYLAVVSIRYASHPSLVKWSAIKADPADALACRQVARLLQPETLYDSFDLAFTLTPAFSALDLRHRR